jgi:hypothetical protein
VCAAIAAVELNFCASSDEEAATREPFVACVPKLPDSSIQSAPGNEE